MYEIDPSVFTSGVLRHESSNGLFLLADSNVCPEIPFVREGREDLQPTLVYVTSPITGNDSNGRILESSFQGTHNTFTMNPWTLFELELMKV